MESQQLPCWIEQPCLLALPKLCQKWLCELVHPNKEKLVGHLLAEKDKLSQLALEHSFLEGSLNYPKVRSVS